MIRKNAPSYSLKKLQEVFCNEKVVKQRMTGSAYYGMVALNFNHQDVINAIQSLTEKDFYKSMPPENMRFSAWQDVYYKDYKGVCLYIKFQVNDDNEIILSFKER